MIFNMMPYFPLFLSTTLISIFMVGSSSNWLFIWVGLELNLLSFIPLAMYWNNNNETEAMVKYFLTQAVASGLMLMSAMFFHSFPMALTSMPSMSFIILISLLLKVGAAPCHFWFPQVMNSLPWLSSILLATIQKMNPILILMYLFNMWSVSLLFILAALNGLIAGLGGLNQTQMKSLIAYSSIGHIAWMISAPVMSYSMALLYFLFYLLITSSLMFLLLKINSFSLNQFNMLFNHPLPLNTFMFLNLLSLAGLPPLLGFLPKWLLLNLMTPYYPLFSSMLITSSLITLFYYLSLFFSSTLNSLKSFKFNASNYYLNMFFFASFPLFLFFTFLYALAILN